MRIIVIYLALVIGGLWGIAHFQSEGVKYKEGLEWANRPTDVIPLWRQDADSE